MNRSFPVDAEWAVDTQTTRRKKNKETKKEEKETFV
jgi:hypothetical protein